MEKPHLHVREPPRRPRSPPICRHEIVFMKSYLKRLDLYSFNKTASIVRMPVVTPFLVRLTDGAAAAQAEALKNGLTNDLAGVLCVRVRPCPRARAPPSPTAAATDFPIAKRPTDRPTDLTCRPRITRARCSWRERSEGAGRGRKDDRMTDGKGLELGKTNPVVCCDLRGGDSLFPMIPSRSRKS